MAASSQVVYQLKITLINTSPPVWRRVLVYGHSTFLSIFHCIIQECMGWLDYHAHAFEHNGAYYTYVGPDVELIGNELDEEKYTIQDVLTKEGQSMKYTYDFGDCWEHRVLLEEILSSYREKKLPYCLAGKRSCPPEDIGGTYGYKELLAYCAGTLKEMIEPQYYQEVLKGYQETFGDEHGFDPDEVDLAYINKKMEYLR